MDGIKCSIRVDLVKLHSRDSQSIAKRFSVNNEWNLNVSVPCNCLRYFIRVLCDDSALFRLVYFTVPVIP